MSTKLAKLSTSFLLQAALILILTIALPVSWCTNANAAPQPASTVYDGEALYQRAFEIIRDQHIALYEPARRTAWVNEWQNKFAGDPRLKTESGTDELVQEMLDSLGYSFDSYSLPKKAESQLEQQQASYVGIGVMLLVKDTDSAPDTVVTDATPMFVSEDPDPHSPAAKAGIKIGDRIVAINGEPLAGLTFAEAVKLLKGPTNTSVEVLLNNSQTPVTITRASIRSRVAVYKDLGDGVSYIKLRHFVSQYTVSEMQESLEKAARSKALILDLRGNTGGFIDYAEAIGQQIMPNGTILVMERRVNDTLVVDRNSVETDLKLVINKTRGDNSSITVTYYNRVPLILPAELPVAVLVNEGTASSAEILSGMLKVNHRATIIGTVTFGKGVGQTSYDLPNGRKIKVTTSDFYPGGAPLDRIGIMPDIEIANTDRVVVDPQKDQQLQTAIKHVLEETDEFAARHKRLMEIRTEKEKMR